MLKLVVLSPSEAMLLVCGVTTKGRASSTLADSMGKNPVVDLSINNNTAAF